MLYIDIETDGLPIDNSLRWPQYKNFPEIIQISWQLDEKPLEDYYVKYLGKKTEFFSKHITKELLDKEGISHKELINKITLVLTETKVIIAHNCDFDYNVLFAFLYKNKVNMRKYLHIKQFCTMENGRFITKFPNFKYPKLGELYKRICGNDLDSEQAHNSKYDVLCLIEIIKKSEILNKAVAKLILCEKN